MKIFSKLHLILFPLLAICLSLSVQAKEYSIPELNIEVQINEDGTVTITEHRTYFFEGNYSWANYRLPKSGYSAIKSIQVLEGQTAFTNINTEEPGTFLVEESDEDFNIKWFYDAEDEERVFTIQYTLEKAVVTGNAWSEFFWTFAASGREKSTETLNIEVRLPEDVPVSRLYSWVRQPAWKIQTEHVENGYHFSGQDINRNQAVTIRLVFPTSVFNDRLISISDPNFSLQRAEQEEANIVEQRRIEAEDEARRKALAWEIVPILGAISILGFIFFYRKYGSRHQVRLSSNESIMLPGREKPAVIGWLLNNKTVTPGLIMATLLDLARQDYFTIKENEPEEKGWLGSKDSFYTVHRSDKQETASLSDYEKSLLNFVSNRISEERNKLEEIFKFSDSNVSKWYSKWKKSLKEQCQSKEWIDPESYKGLYANLAFQIVLLIAGIVGVFLLHPLMFILIAISFIGGILSFIIIRRTPKGEEVYQKWNNYRKAIQHAKDYSISENHLGLHFIYSIAFGVGKKHIEDLFEANPDAASAIYWIVILPGMHTSPADIASSFSQLAATGTATAGGGNIGGGASAGVAGGGASGGAG